VVSRWFMLGRGTVICLLCASVECLFMQNRRGVRAWRHWRSRGKLEVATKNAKMRGDVSPDQNALSLEDRLSDDPNGHQALSCNEGSEGARGVRRAGGEVIFAEVEGDEGESEGEGEGPAFLR
jgi:hypothetical protein